MFPTFDSIVTGIVTSVIGWTTVYFLFCNYLPHHTSEWHCRCVTVLHAVIVVMLSAWSAFIQGPWPFSDPGNFCSLLLVAHTFISVVWCQGHYQNLLYFSRMSLFQIRDLINRTIAQDIRRYLFVILQMKYSLYSSGVCTLVDFAKWCRVTSHTTLTNEHSVSSAGYNSSYWF